MKKSLLLFLLPVVFLAACAVIQQRVEIEWPAEITYLEGEGDLDTAWRKERYSGSFVLRMEHPDTLLLDVYGPFGQTLVHVKKEGDQFLFVAGNEKTTSESAFREVYGLEARQLIDDLAMRGQKEATPEGWVLYREDYRVVWGQDRVGRRKTCWESKDGRICLTFNDISFTRK